MRRQSIAARGWPRSARGLATASSDRPRCAYFIMKNTNKLTSKEFEEIKIEKESVEDIEESLIKEHLGQIKVKDLDISKEEKLTKELMKILNQERKEGERVIDFEKRVNEEVEKILEGFIEK